MYVWCMYLSIYFSSNWNGGCEWEAKWERNSCIYHFLASFLSHCLNNPVEDNAFLLVSIVCHNNTIDWVTETYFSTVLEARSSRPGCQYDWVLARALFLVRKGLPSPCVLTWQRERGSERASCLVSLLIRALIP